MTVGDGKIEDLQTRAAQLADDPEQSLMPAKDVRVRGANTDAAELRRAEEEAHRTLLTQAGIVRVQQEIASADLNLTEVMNLMAERAQALIGAAGACIELVEGQEMVSMAAAGMAVDQIGLRLKLDGSLAGRAASSGEVLHCEDSMTDDRVDKNACRITGVRSIIAAPLRAQDRVIGVLKVVSDRPHAFTRNDFTNLQILVESLGAVIQRHRTTEQLRKSEAQYRLLFEHNPHPMFVYEVATLRILAVNRSAIDHYGYTEPEFLALTVRDLHPPEDIPRVERTVMTSIHAPKRLHQWQHLKRDGSMIDVEISSDSIDFNGRHARLTLAYDVTERVRAERELARVSRAQKMLSACNEALIRASDEGALLTEVCRITVEIGGYCLAWVGFAQEDDAKSILPVTHFGKSAGYVESIRLSWADGQLAGQGPAEQTVRRGGVVIIDDLSSNDTFQPWLSSARERGYRGAIWLPLRGKEHTFGLIGLYSEEVMQVGEDEIGLLQALADDLAFGIINIRSQAERRRLELAAVKVAAGVSASTGKEFFERLACNMAEAVGGQAGIVAQLLPGEPLAVRTVAIVIDGQVRSNFSHAVRGTPYEKLLEVGEWIVPDKLAEFFPDTAWLASLGAQACVGRRLDNSAGEPAGLLFVLFDAPMRQAAFIASTLQIFAARAAAELERQEADARIREQASLLDQAKEAIIVRGIDNKVRFWNKGAERLYGWTPAEAIGRSVEELLAPDAVALADANRAVVTLGEWSGEVVEHRKDGSTIMVESNLTLVRDDKGQPQSVFAIKTDITQRKAAEREIEYLAFYDPLTRLPNRQLLMDRLRHGLANSARSRLEGALLFIDLDNFKALNDTLGHDMGDQLLQQVAERIKMSVRDSDTVARLGGDEFVIMLENLGGTVGEAVEHARMVGEKIIAALNQPYKLAHYEHHSTPSIGIALFNEHHDNVGELLKRADLAMYQAKAAGRNTLRFFDPAMQAAASGRAALEADLRQALRENEFVLHYQPQVHLNGRMTGVEALVRWRHSRRGMVSPAEFIPAAEDTGLILGIGQWVLETACAQLAAWAARTETAGLDMAINVSVRQFRHPDFLGQVLDVLERTGADPQRLKLELTESLLVDNVEETIAKMSALKAKGVGFSLDDFGTGYSSLFYLKRLPLDLLKIDQSFVRDVLSDPNDAAIARTIVALGQSLGLAVIAEGVETEDQRAFLAQHGCQAYQGYLFSRPLPIEQLEAFMRARG